MDFNQQQYEQYGFQYLNSNQNGDVGGGTPETRVRFLQEYLPVGRSIFEIGSGGGMDALELQKVGYHVTASDFTDTFVKTLQGKGLETVFFDAKKDELPNTFDAIYANAVFVHFAPEDFSAFLKRVQPKLTNEKLIFLSVIKGLGHERASRSRGFERDFFYYELSFLELLFKQSGYTVLKVKNDYEKWIQLIAKSSL